MSGVFAFLGVAFVVVCLVSFVYWFLGLFFDVSGEKAELAKRLEDESLAKTAKMAKRVKAEANKEAEKLEQARLIEARLAKSFEESLENLKSLECDGLDELVKLKLIGRLQQHYDWCHVKRHKTLSGYTRFPSYVSGGEQSDYLVEMKFRGVIL